MPSNLPCNRWIFREGKSSSPGTSVRAALVSALSELHHPTRDRLVDALIRTGELETALADSGSEAAHAVAGITNALAAGLVAHAPCPVPLHHLAPIAAEIPVPEQIELSTPEGFAYYALHPLAYAELFSRLRFNTARVAVIGIRSIGSTLSAVVVAAAAKQNMRADRITVRPGGHPYDRKTRFTSAQLRWIAGARHERAEFLVVDEGPGLSGSSFLSVGEALLGAGVERTRIHFLCSHEVDPSALVSSNAAERWCGFRSHWVHAHKPPGEGLIDVSAGRWRESFLDDRSVPSWTHMERMKFLSRDGRRLLKFAGLGRFGEVTERRAQLLASGGFAPQCFGVHDGYAEYEMLRGRPMRADDLSRPVIERIADYCAMRTTQFAVENAGESQLEAMARYNYEQEFGEPAPRWLQLPSSTSPVLCDGRMQPHEWIVAPDGKILKTDGESHGDDHFFPGPTDIAWDLAGAIVEWQMDRGAEDLLLLRFARLTGDDAAPRIEVYKAAYCLFGMSYSTMAANALSRDQEYPRLVAASERYRATWSAISQPVPVGEQTP